MHAVVKAWCSLDHGYFLLEISLIVNHSLSSKHVDSTSDLIHWCLMAIFARICYCDHCPTDGHNNLSKINNSLLKSGFLSLSIHLLIFIQFRVMVRLESIPAVIGWEVWYTLDRLPVCCRVREAIKLAVLTLANGTVKQKMCQIHQHKPAGSASLDFWNLTRCAAAARLKTWVFTAVSVFTAVLMIHGYRSSEFETVIFCTHVSLKQREMSHQFQKMRLFLNKVLKDFQNNSNFFSFVSLL